MKGISLALLSVYLHPDDEYTNHRTQYDISTFLDAYKGPFLVGGDMNEDPHHMEETDWSLVHKGRIMLPENSQITCSAVLKDSLIDYGFGSCELCHIAKAYPEYEVLCKVHIGVNTLSMIGHTLCWPNSLSGPRPW